ncbi:MAG: hypothetical protein M3N29_01710 [Chloroflexota bacterium]|nr:hypothetical protein [Chloroflexota bacterium]
MDASPLIYLAKLDALDVFTNSGHLCRITPEVERETARAGLSYEHPDALVVADAIRSGLLVRTELTPDEMAVARRLEHEAGGVDRGEAEVLAAATSRAEPALLFERRATRLARSMGIDTWSPVRLLFAGTRSPVELRERVGAFGRLVNMRLVDVQKLLNLIQDGAQ